MDIYDYHDNLVNLISNDKKKLLEISTKFRNFHNNYEKINFSIELIKNYNIIKHVTKYIPKSEEKCIELRSKGNAFFSLKTCDYMKALDCYNQSICFAENDSKNLAIGYANRSAIYFEIKEYKKCLENILLSRSCKNYPDLLNEKLLRRETNCLSKLKTLEGVEDEIVIEPDLSYAPHKDIPFISECLEFKENNEYGRFIITNNKLNVGDLIALEKPFCTVLQSHLIYQRCSTCLSENKYSLIPCKYCTKAMFCSQACYESGYQQFHRFECIAIDGLMTLFNKIHLSALHAVLKVFSNSLEFEKVKQFIENCNETLVNPFTIKYNDDSIHEQYKAVHTLATNEDKRTNSDLFQRSSIAAVMFIFLKDNNFLREIFKKDSKNQDIFLNLLFRHLQSSPTNFHSLEFIENLIDDSDLSYASGAFPFASMINHSCAPNIMRQSIHGKQGLIVIRPIMRGGQLFDNYGYHHGLLTKKDRTEKLDQYNFACQCEACVFDYPQYNDLTDPQEVPMLDFSNIKENLYSFDKDFAKKSLGQYTNLLNEYDNFYPCRQLLSVQEALKMCYNILYKNIPFRFKYQMEKMKQTM